jgi:hypothetical protein
MGRLETVARDAATITVCERRRTTATRMKATEAAAISAAANAIRDNMQRRRRRRARRPTAPPTIRVAEATTVAMAWGLLGKEEEKEDLCQVH